MAQQGEGGITLTPDEYVRIMDHLERDAIRQVVIRYVRGADRLDEELERGAYWPDGYDNHGFFRGNAQEFVTWALGLGGRLAGLQHILGQSFIDMEAAGAKCETYFLVCESTSRDTPTDNLRQLGGRYVDILEKRGGSWKIAHRDVVIDWSASLHDVARYPGVEQFTAGQPAPDDYSYHPVSMERDHGPSASRIPSA